MNKDIIFFRNMDILVDKNIVKTIKDYSGQHYYPHSCGLCKCDYKVYKK